MPGFGPSGSTFDLESNNIIAGAQMHPPPQQQEQEPDLVELPEAPQIYTNQEEPASGPRFMGSHTFQSREVPPVRGAAAPNPVRQAAAPDPARDLQRLQRELLNMGGHGSLAARDAHHAAQAESLVAAHGSDDAQWARGAAAALDRIRRSGVSGSRTEAEEAVAQANSARMGAVWAQVDRQRVELRQRREAEAAAEAQDGPTEIRDGSETDSPDEECSN